MPTARKTMTVELPEDLPTARIRSTQSLEDIYGAPVPRSLWKEIDHISPHYRAFIEKAPFLVLATVGEDGLDCSPRGDAPGFVRIFDTKTLLLPDRRGNNRIDSLRNIVRDPRISLLFLIPGVGETLRINGTAEITADPDLCAAFTVNGAPPRSVIIATAERVYFQCQKALVRSRLWDPEMRIPRSDLPSTGEIIQALAQENFDGAAYDSNYPEHMKKTLY